jgi:cytochrome b561
MPRAGAPGSSPPQQGCTFRCVFPRSGEPLPADFDIHPSFVAHSLLATLLTALIALHVVAALYHQFVRKDALLRRMFFGRRLS